MLSFLVHFIPASLINLVLNCVVFTGLGAGAIAFFFGWVPGVRQYKTLLYVVSLLLTVPGSYFKGMYSASDDYQLAMKEMQVKVDTAQAQSAATNTVVKDHVVTKVQHIHDVQTQIKTVIQEKEKLINAECTVPQEAIDLLNAAARNEHPAEGVAQ